MDLNEKYRLLSDWFRQQGTIAVAFSGGTDSTFVLSAARESLKENVIALSVKTPYIPDWEMQEAISFCKENNIKHYILRESIIEGILNNPENRCYLCKSHLFNALKNEALKYGYKSIADGTNADDTGAYRPGLAALKEHGIKSPLLDAGITKKEVRELSRLMGLKTAEKPSYACLLTRLPYNYRIDIKELERIEKAERFMASIGFADSRVRNHHEIARIELQPARMTEFIHTSKDAGLTDFFHTIGYRFITVDLEGYRSGSFDEGIKNK
jgi:uncharacterized protein